MGVAIPFDPGQVSTRHNRFIGDGRGTGEKSQSLLIQGRFQPFLWGVGRKRIFCRGRNPFWSRAGFNLYSFTLGLFRHILVAIPFDPGQVSTTGIICNRKFHNCSRNPFWSRAGFNSYNTGLMKLSNWLFLVAIPFDPGQVSTWSYQVQGFWKQLSQSLLIQGRFQQRSCQL